MFSILVVLVVVVWGCLKFLSRHQKLKCADCHRREMERPIIHHDDLIKEDDSDSDLSDSSEDSDGL
jgi:hypothetical protein